MVSKVVFSSISAVVLAHLKSVHVEVSGSLEEGKVEITLDSTEISVDLAKQSDGYRDLWIDSGTVESAPGVTVTVADGIKVELRQCTTA